MFVCIFMNCVIVYTVYMYIHIYTRLACYSLVYNNWYSYTIITIIHWYILICSIDVTNITMVGVCLFGRFMLRPHVVTEFWHHIGNLPLFLS